MNEMTNEMTEMTDCDSTPDHLLLLTDSTLTPTETTQSQRKPAYG